MFVEKMFRILYIYMAEKIALFLKKMMKGKTHMNINHVTLRHALSKTFCQAN